MDYLIKALYAALFGDPIQRTVSLKPKEGRLRAELYDLNAIIKEEIDEEGNYILSIDLARADFERLFPEHLDTAFDVNSNKSE